MGLSLINPIAVALFTGEGDCPLSVHYDASNGASAHLVLVLVEDRFFAMPYVQTEIPIKSYCIEPCTNHKVIARLSSYPCLPASDEVL